MKASVPGHYYPADLDVVWAERPATTSLDAHLKEMVEIHETMFKALLGLDCAKPARELAVHFEEIAKRYMTISAYLTTLASINGEQS